MTINTLDKVAFRTRLIPQLRQITSTRTFTSTYRRMAPHNITEYVAYHQQKLREQQTRKPKGGVNLISSKESLQQALESHDVVVVDFFAEWCGPCKMIAPKLAEWSNELQDKAYFVKIDVDNAPELAAEHKISAMPTFKIFKNGKEVDKILGANPAPLKAKIDAVVQ